MRSAGFLVGLRTAAVSRRTYLALLGVALVAVVAWVELAQVLGSDYFAEAGPAVQALVRGHWDQFLRLAPAYGGSLLIRAPVLLTAHILGAGTATLYRAGAVFCLLAVLGLALWLIDVFPLRRGEPAARVSGTAKVAILVVCLANPAVFEALRWGHPEEILGGALVVGAVLAALAGRAELAGVLLGLAIANKQWALLAVGPVLVALPHRRLRALIWGGVTAALLMAPFALAGGAVSRGGAPVSGATFQRWQLWWFLGSAGHPLAANHLPTIGYRSAPPWLSPLAHPLIVAMSVPLCLGFVWVRRQRSGSRLDPLLLLALLLLLRCALDPWDISYYWVPFLLALTSWEALRFSRPPLLAAGAAAAAWFTMQETANPALALSTDMQALIFTVVALTGLVALSVAVFAPRRRSTASPQAVIEPRALALGA